jgi:hypothetical protein
MPVSADAPLVPVRAPPLSRAQNGVTHFHYQIPIHSLGQALTFASRHSGHDCEAQLVCAHFQQSTRSTFEQKTKTKVKLSVWFEEVKVDRVFAYYYCLFAIALRACTPVRRTSCCYTVAWFSGAASLDDVSWKLSYSGPGSYPGVCGRHPCSVDFCRMKALRSTGGVTCLCPQFLLLLLNLRMKICVTNDCRIT